jgi:hypothetical protein
MPTFFLQTAAVDAKGELAADWWVTFATYDDEGQALRAAREFAGERMMVVSPAQGARRAKAKSRSSRSADRVSEGSLRGASHIDPSGPA